MAAIGLDVGHVVDEVRRRGQHAQDQEAETDRRDLAEVAERMPDEQRHEQEQVLRPLVDPQGLQHGHRHRGRNGVLIDLQHVTRGAMFRLPATANLQGCAARGENDGIAAARASR
jgi:hypothetical protein